MAPWQVDQDPATTVDEPLKVPLLLDDDLSVPSNHKGQDRSTLWSVCSFIILCEFCERMAFFGMAGSIILFFQNDLHMTNADADNQYSLWSGVCYVTPLLGGWIADTYLGRYKSILVFSSIYVVGLALLVVGVIPGHVSAEVVFPALYLISLSTGGIKPNVSTYGADQFDPSNPRDKKELDSFFNYFYWSINLGALIAYTAIAYICQYGLGSLGGKKWGFVVGFTIPCISMLIAVLTFVAGTPRYKKSPHQGNSALSTAFKIIGEAALSGPTASTWLDRAKKENGGSFDCGSVEGVKSVVRLLPYLVLTVPYWICYNQMSTAFQNQGCQMDLRVGDFDLPVSALNLFDTLVILLLIPVFDSFIYPAFKKAGYPLTMLQKIGCGFGFSILSMVAAMATEVYRKKMAPEEYPYSYYVNNDLLDYLHSNFSPCKDISDYINSDEVVPLIAPISIFWQIPQFLLVGTSEILAAVTVLEFFYSQSPKPMRSFCQALNLFTNSMGSWLCIPLVYLVNSNKSHPWIPSNVNQGQLNMYFGLLAVIMLVDLLAFIRVSRTYEYQNLDDEDDGHDQQSIENEAAIHGHVQEGTAV